ncbi:hypothetical protein TNIN_485751 [Trichonephila inaurata madagascariensis]|uniref:SHSP domain-containing protein n=1 Tax=Trichonephila inaurata madagascariensis TaxID=2747483 RepID=A0A8X6XE05_9ARAC|nr:hypothetical protein TNIN_485751 [Trichonephila inaurata madagascariensis]
MALAALFDELPVSSLDANRRRRNRPLMLNFLDFLENQMDQRVGHVFRRLPAVLLELDDEHETSDNGRKRKRKADALSLYEPKTKCQVTTNGDKFQVQLDTSNYQPDEITVKVINDKLAITAKHETKGDDVYEYHEMARSFDLPESVDPQTVTSRLSSNGQLTVEAPMKPQKDSVTERVVPVKMTEDPQPADKAENKDTQTPNSDSK